MDGSAWGSVLLRHSVADGGMHDGGYQRNAWWRRLICMRTEDELLTCSYFTLISSHILNFYLAGFLHLINLRC